MTNFRSGELVQSGEFLTFSPRIFITRPARAANSQRSNRPKSHPMRCHLEPALSVRDLLVTIARQKTSPFEPPAIQRFSRVILRARNSHSPAPTKPPSQSAISTDPTKPRRNLPPAPNPIPRPSTRLPDQSPALPN